MANTICPNRNFCSFFEFMALPQAPTINEETGFPRRSRALNHRGYHAVVVRAPARPSSGQDDIWFRNGSTGPNGRVNVPFVATSASA